MRVWAMILVSGWLAACDNGTGEQDTASSDAGTVQLQVWAHAGQAAERQVLQEQVARFNRSHDSSVRLTFIPERDYNAQVQAATLAGDLPDVLEFDGPYLYNYIWQNQLIPLDELLSPALKDDLLPSIVAQGTYDSQGGADNKLYSVGVFDSGLGLFARRQALLAAGARIPHGAADAWSIDEFDALLARLATKDRDGAVLDLKLNYRGEWFTYGFSPLLQSAGADLIERDHYRHSRGMLDSDAAVSAMQHLQDWINSGYVDPNLDDAAFIDNRVALSWVGHWEYGRYREAFGDDLVVLPLPDFGTGSKTGQGSWNWGITRRSPHPRAAAEFITFLLQPDEVLAMTEANGAVPGTKSAVRRSGRYGEQGALRLFADQLLSGVSIPRPKTPAYPVITTQFQRAFQAIRNGAEVKSALHEAAQAIDQDIEDNRGYPFVAP